jgi:acetoin:2,6-dichlorophenolindophenol oxidoreductase subunit alpha
VARIAQSLVASTAAATDGLRADLDMLLLIRHFEWKLLALFGAGELNGTTHTCLGQELVPVCLRDVLARAYVVSNHRGHGHYLARHQDPAGLLAEIMGREGGVSGGVGGSQHLGRDGFWSTGVQGSGVPLALGLALHAASAGTPDLAVVFVGDGTWGQGVVYETLNMAQLWCAPLVVVVENNGIAQSTPVERHLAGTIGGRAAAFGVRHVRVEATDLDQMRRTVAEPIAMTAGGAGPVVVEFVTERLGPHSKGDDTRDPADVARLAEGDWYRRYADSFPEIFAEADRRQRDLVARVAAEVAARAPADWPAELRPPR